jgi:hypothetical protein
MSVEAISAALPRRGLTPTQKLVLIGIANHDGDGGAWPSVSTLSNYAECSVRQVQRALADLVEMGLVEREVNGGGTKRTPDHTRPNLYRLHLSPGDTQVTPPPDLGVTTPLTPMSPEPSSNRPVEPEEPPYPPQAGGAARILGAEVAQIPMSLGDMAIEHVLDDLWAAWPKGRKQGRPAARRALKAALKKTNPASIATGLQLWLRYWEAKNEPQFVPMPSTWLNQERWNDDPPPLPKPKTGVGGNGDATLDFLQRNRPENRP